MEGGRGARGTFRAVPGRMAGRGGATGCSGRPVTGQQQGREGQSPGSESQGLSHHRCPLSPRVQPAGLSVAGTPAGRVHWQRGRGLTSPSHPPPIISTHILPPPAGHLSAVIWDKGGGGGWSPASWAMGTERACGRRETPTIRRQIQGCAHSGCRGSRHFVLACVCLRWEEEERGE